MKMLLGVLAVTTALLHECFVTASSHFRLTYGVDKNESSLKGEFFQCSCETHCTNVVKMENGKFQTVYGEEELKSLKGIVCIWEKVQVIIPTASGNIARGKNTSQSSTAFEGVASRAVDGDKTGDYSAGKTCTHTKQEAKPWWRVDLGSIQAVRTVLIANRVDSTVEAENMEQNWKKLGQVQITVGNVDHPDSNALCAYFPGIVGEGETKVFECCSPISGRYVFVALRGEGTLTLCEVEVYAI